MKCYVHTDRDATASCRCGKGLCSECARKYSTPTCDECVRNYYAGVLAEKRKNLIWTAIVAVIGFICGMGIAETNGSLMPGLLGIYMFLSVYWGWIYVKPMLFATIFGSIIWKGNGFILGMMLVCLAMCLGIIVGAFKFIKNIVELIQARRTLTALA